MAVLPVCCVPDPVLRRRAKRVSSLDGSVQRESFDDLDIGPVSPEAGVQDLQDRLALDAPPRVIEGIDISSISGKQATGSKVVTSLLV